MGLKYLSLSPEVRTIMAEELAMDRKSNLFYPCPRIEQKNFETWLQLLSEAVGSQDDDWLTSQLGSAKSLKTKEERKTKNGTSLVSVPVTASATLAEGEFNRLYMRAVCVKAMRDGVSSVTIYRGKEVESPRAESVALENKTTDAKKLLDKLRTKERNEDPMGLPPGPNSGMTVRLNK